jgi:hypothetical protein
MNLWLLWLGCNGSDPSAISAYLQATRDPALRSCSEISDAGLAGECAALRARDLAKIDERSAIEACATIAPGMWQDECYFLVSDAVDATGAKADALCATAGRFSSQTLSHAASRLSRAPGVLKVHDD